MEKNDVPFLDALFVIIINLQVLGVFFVRRLKNIHQKQKIA